MVGIRRMNGDECGWKLEAGRVDDDGGLTCDDDDEDFFFAGRWMRGGIVYKKDRSPLLFEQTKQTRQDT